MQRDWSRDLALDPRTVLKGRPRALYARLWDGRGLRREDYLTLQEASERLALSRGQLRSLLQMLGVETMPAPEDLRKRIVPRAIIEEIERRRAEYRASSQTERG